MSPVPDLPEPKSTWEWVTGGVFALLTVLAGIARWLHSHGSKDQLAESVKSEQLDRIEEQLKMLAKTLTVQNEDGYPISTSRRLAERLEARLDRIEKRLDEKRSTRRGQDRNQD